MRRLLEKYNIYLQVGAYTLSVMIIPMTAWFLTLSSNVDTAIANIEHMEKKIDRFENYQDSVSHKLDIIHKDIGEVKGELKRIK